MPGAEPRIVVDALSAEVGGGLTYLVNQLGALRRVRPDLDLTVLVSTRNNELFRALDVRRQVVRFPNLPARLAYEQWVMPFRVARPDLLYCPANFCPLVPTTFPVVLTLRNAHHFGQGKLLHARSMVRKRAEILLAQASVRRADSVVVVSEALREDLRLDGMDGPRVHVIRSGAPEWPSESLIPTEMGVTDDFLLSLANDQPAKRLDDIVVAWKAAFQSDSEYPALVFAGDIEDSRRAVHKALAGEPMASGLIYLGRVPNRANVMWLLQHARAMVSASELESFGLTVVEAGTLGCPALVTNLPAHRETGEGHVKFFEPRDTRELTRLLADTDRRDVSEDQWKWSVSWEENAVQLSQLFDSLIGQR